jgi:hypothetical protein
VLQEAGEETLGTLLNTLRDRPDPESHASSEFSSAVEDLLGLGFVAWEPHQDSAPLALARFNELSCEWTSPADDVSNRPVSLVLTRTGRKCLSA